MLESILKHFPPQVLKALSDVSYRFGFNRVGAFLSRLSSLSPPSDDRR